MPWLTEDDFDTPDDEFISERISQVFIEVDYLLDQRDNIFAHADAGEFEAGLDDCARVSDSTHRALGKILEILLRLYSIYPWGSNELASRVLERLNSEEPLDIPNPPEE